MGWRPCLCQASTLYCDVCFVKGLNGETMDVSYTFFFEGVIIGGVVCCSNGVCESATLATFSPLYSGQCG
jgi:hypothetical protein